jgi:hypothetical protein
VTGERNSTGLTFRPVSQFATRLGRTPLSGGLDEGRGAVGDQEAAAGGELADYSAGEWGHPKLAVDFELWAQGQPDPAPANGDGPVGVAGAQYVGSARGDDPNVVASLA